MSSDPIDLIIGADIYGQVLLHEVRQGSACTPTAQNTTLGWILSSPPLAESPMSSVKIYHISLLEALDQNLKRFWELEDLPSTVMLTPIMVVRSLVVAGRSNFLAAIVSSVNS